MACRYYNEEKNDPWNGIYCDYMGGRPGVAYWRCYCDGNSSRCPILGGDDPYELDPETVRKREREEERKRREKEERLRREREYREEQEQIRERERQEEQKRIRERERQKEQERNRRNKENREQGGQQYHDQSGNGVEETIGAGGRSSGGKYKSSSSSLSAKVALVLVGLLVLVVGGWYAGAKMGLIRSTVTVDAKAPTSGLFRVEDVALRAVVQDGEYKESTAQFDESGQCKLKLHPGMNAVYVEYDGTSVYLDSYLGNGFKFHSVELNLDITEKLMARVLIVELQDVQGTQLYPETVTVTNSKGDPIQCRPVKDGMYVMLFGNETPEETLELSVEGYEPIDITANLTGRMSHMIITLAK